MGFPDFLVVELPTMGETPGRFSKAHPHVIIDQIVTAVSEPAGPVYHLTTFAAGLRPGETAELLAELQAAYPDLTTLRRDDAVGHWLGTFRLPTDWLRDPAAIAVNDFIQAHGLEARWLRLQEGRVYAKLRLPDGARAQGLAQRLRGFLEGRAIDGDVAVEQGSSDHLAPWAALADTLMEQGLQLPMGLAERTR